MNFTQFSRLLIMLVTISVSSAFAEDQCVSGDDHSRMTFLLLDRSDEIKDTKSLEQSLNIVADAMVSEERLVVGVITGKAGETRIIMDKTLPKEGIWESSMKIRRGKRDFKECFDQMKNEILGTSESHKTSSILETLRFAARVIEQSDAESKRLVLYSDMIQNSGSLSFYKIAPDNPQAMLSKVESEGLSTSLTGVGVYVAGAGGNVSDKYARKIENFWRAYLKKSGALLKFYGPILLEL